MKKQILAFLFLAGGAAMADTITITLDSPTLGGPAGSTLAFTGTLTNTTGQTVYLNGDNYNVNLPSGAFDGSPFWNNAPLDLTASGTGGGASGDIGLFNIVLPAPFATGNYGGTFQILGGADGNAQDILGTASFTVDVQSVSSGTPEPSTLVLLLSAGALLLVRHRNQSVPCKVNAAQS